MKQHTCTPRIFLCDADEDIKRKLCSPAEILWEPALAGTAAADGVVFSASDGDFDRFFACYPYLLGSVFHLRRFRAKLERIGIGEVCADPRVMWERIARRLREHPVSLGQYLYGGRNGVGAAYRNVTVRESAANLSGVSLIRIALPAEGFFSLPDRPDQPDSLRNAANAGKLLSPHEEKVLFTDNLLSVCRAALAAKMPVWLVTGDTPVVGTLTQYQKDRVSSGLGLTVGNYADIACFLDYAELRAARGKLLIEARDARDVQNACALAAAFRDITVGVGAGVGAACLQAVPPNRTVFMQDPVCPAAFPPAPTARDGRQSFKNLLRFLAR